MKIEFFMNWKIVKIISFVEKFPEKISASALRASAPSVRVVSNNSVLSGNFLK